ncbi:MAG: integrase core domain-containing protein [Chloroflexota bacterium]
MFAKLFIRIKRTIRTGWQQLQQKVLRWTTPIKVSVTTGVLGDITRSKSELILENVLLRQQLIVVSRQVKRPAPTSKDRLVLVLIASKLRHWQQALLILQPDTVLRWHRDLFKWVWKRKSKATGHRPPLSATMIALIKRLVSENRLWGAERVRGELLKLGIIVSKRTIQKYARQVSRPRSGKQTWTTFIHNHADVIWACDFVQVTDVFFRDLFAFFIIEVGSRQVIHAAVTRHPSDAWLAQQLREATPFGAAPKYLIRDNDSKYGTRFAAIAHKTGIQLLKTPFRAPRANAFCERFIGSVRRECLDHLFILSEAHLCRMVRAYVDYFNHARPHQGIDQRLPMPSVHGSVLLSSPEKVVSTAILGGLHHDYQIAA